MRIAIFGAGGAGGYFGGRLAQAGKDVVFIARGEHLRAIRERGLRVDSLKGDFAIQPAQATDDPAQAGVVDAIIVAVKTWQLPEAAIAMRPMVGPGTMVVPLLNGVDAPAQLSDALGADAVRVLGGLCQIVSLMTGPGHIRHAGIEPLIAFGELDGSASKRVERLRQAFARCEGLTVEVPADIRVALWRKFMFITAISGVGAVTRAPAGAMRSVPGARQLLEGAMREVVAVAHARGIALPDDAPEKAMAFIDNLPPAATASMQRDVIEGRRSELEAQNGAVVRLGKEAGVPTPIHAFLYHSLLPMELKARGEIQFG